ncbi:MAG: 16S rRNA (guanine(527)-N(7))-methyltransferase RsmG [Oscillospiraceae bacterium]|nr:16S rRNA (guanine(527)-N(7))-methyltransferase RsmG [Oscillospiraceae bacterium]
MLEELLQRGLAEMGIPADAQALERFCTYYDALEAANREMNLTAVSGENAVARLHFLDSAAPLLLFPLEGRSAIDIGAGAGFPGLPLKILCPALSLTLLDSLGKRVDFLRGVCARLELDDVTCVHGRAEECGARREQFDFALSRAVARLNVLCELCLPYVRPGGAFLALKGPAAREEADEATAAISALGGTLERIFDYSVPGETLRHNIVVIRKTAPTPQRYPRRFAAIKKRPL